MQWHLPHRNYGSQKIQVQIEDKTPDISMEIKGGLFYFILFYFILNATMYIGIASVERQLGFKIRFLFRQRSHHRIGGMSLSLY